MSAEQTSLLVGIDFSQAAERALSQAVDLTQRLQAVLHVVYVNEPLSVAAMESTARYDDILGRIDRERVARRSQGAELCARLIADKVPYTFEVFDAMAIDGLLEAVHKYNPELVVVGSHGRGAFKRMLLGSVSTALCHRCSVPVLVVPPTEHRA